MLNDDKFYRHYLLVKYNFTFSLVLTTYKLTSDKKPIFREISTFTLFLTNLFQLPSPPKFKDYPDEDFCKVI